MAIGGRLYRFRGLHVTNDPLPYTGKHCSDQVTRDLLIPSQCLLRRPYIHSLFDVMYRWQHIVRGRDHQSLGRR